MLKIILASDHAGLELKNELVKLISSLGLEATDLGPFDLDSVDYPDYAKILCDELSYEKKGEDLRGILVCGSGIGMSMAANRFSHIRAALCHSKEDAKLSREHNNSNVLCLGARTTGKKLVKEILKSWLETDFAGGRHQNRIDKIS